MPGRASDGKKCDFCHLGACLGGVLPPSRAPAYYAGMRFAISIPQFFGDGEFSPADFRAYFERAEAFGVYESAWAQEMTLSPSPQLAPLEAMTYAAACTSSLRLGCTVFVTTLHSPVQLAKDLATLDQVSGGRVEVGVGSGGPRRPFAAYGISGDRYLARFTEGIRLVKALWTEPSVTFDGEFWQLKGAAMEPKPHQKPHPRLWFGGSAEAAVRRGARLCDGFFGAGSSPTAAFASQVATARAAAADVGRRVGFGPGEFPIAKRVYIAIDSASGARARERMNDALARMYGQRVPSIESAAIAGTLGECVSAVRAVIDAGAEMVLFTPLFEVPGHMEQIATELIPRLA